MSNSSLNELNNMILSKCEEIKNSILTCFNSNLIKKQNEKIMDLIKQNKELDMKLKGKNDLTISAESTELNNIKALLTQTMQSNNTILEKNLINIIYKLLTRINPKEENSILSSKTKEYGIKKINAASVNVKKMNKKDKNVIFNKILKNNNVIQGPSGKTCSNSTNRINKTYNLGNKNSMGMKI